MPPEGCIDRRLRRSQRATLPVSFRWSFPMISRSIPAFAALALVAIVSACSDVTSPTRTAAPASPSFSGGPVAGGAGGPAAGGSGGSSQVSKVASPGCGTFTTETFFIGVYTTRTGIGFGRWVPAADDDSAGIRSDRGACSVPTRVSARCRAARTLAPSQCRDTRVLRNRRALADCGRCNPVIPSSRCALSRRALAACMDQVRPARVV